MNAAIEVLRIKEQISKQRILALKELHDEQEAKECTF